MASSLSLQTVVLPKEKTYFGILLALSVILWGALAASLAGAVVALLLGVFLWFVNGLLVSHLKSGAVRVTERQLPELYASFRAACAALGQREEPEFYVLQGNGILNAFATRHAGRDFVVVYSGLLEALGHDTPEIRFLIGHEIGHIRRSHLSKRILLLPGQLVALLYRAYHRACEATCDRFGALAAGETAGSVRAMLVMAAGRETAPRIDSVVFAEQYRARRGFFVSWHELALGYPTLSRRVSLLFGTESPTHLSAAPRNPAAYLFALLFNFQTVLILYIGLVAAGVLMPAWHHGLNRGRQAAAMMEARRRDAAAQPFSLGPAERPIRLAPFARPGFSLTIPPASPAKPASAPLPGEGTSPPPAAQAGRGDSGAPNPPPAP
ncbi:MAG: M48 family metalloprotease [Verrucomicrobium sp.]|nr:M48 family metalloprotease [Verrucomicrobium sp.]